MTYWFAPLLGAIDLYPANYWRFHPHLALSRCSAVGETVAIDPVSWTANEIVLLDSLIGLTQYNVVGR